MSPAEWGGIFAGMVAIAASFLTALRWIVRQFVNEIGQALSTRINTLEIEIGVLMERQSVIYETLINKGVGSGTKKNKGTKTSLSTRKRASRSTH
jgi:hypothetical protein